MDNAILAVCEALADEANIIISHTKRMSALARDNATRTVQKIDELRIDSAVHIQNLTLELTKLIAGGGTDPEPGGEGDAE